MTDATEHLQPWTIEELAENTLSPREKAQAMEHVRHCAQCAGELDASRALVRALSALPRFEPSNTFAASVMARVNVRAFAADEAVQRRWLPQTARGWMMTIVGALAPLLPLAGLLVWLAGRGMSPGALFGMGGRWVTEAGWSLLVRATEAVVRSGIFQWVVTTGTDLVGGTRGLSVAGVMFAIAIPASGLMLLRLLRTPVEGMTHAH
ncbi:MAG TPA: hypothetical protein VJT67_02900 [Longimicrobiaceae bacterium]|nr:hypothetical protein [Longimicrobiaceae bacterium]